MRLAQVGAAHGTAQVRAVAHWPQAHRVQLHSPWAHGAPEGRPWQAPGDRVRPKGGGKRDGRERDKGGGYARPWPVSNLASPGKSFAAQQAQW